ncbi:MAG: MBL fold metallo-hydrolase, partial [Myxococcota bacterium]|nr:MBL fold metallo-hydrolase [Myxococcota bacterium]
MSTTARLVVLAVLAAIVAAMWGLAVVSKRFERVAAGVAALDTRVFDRLTVVVVGSGGSFENPQRGGPAVGVGRGGTLLLVDAGRAVAEGLRAAEVPAHQPRAVLLSSLAAENVLGLDDLWLTGWLGPRAEPLRVLGPAGTGELVEGLRRAHAEAARVEGVAWALPSEGGRLEARTLAPGDTLELGGIRVRTAALGGAGLPALGYRFEADGRAVVVATAGRDPEAVVGLARGADVLVVEAVVGAALDAAREAGVERLEVLEEEAARHPRLEEVGDWAARAGVDTLVLTRLRPPPVFASQYTARVGGGFR